MVAIKTVWESNAVARATVAPGFVAVFAGATNGIGLSTLKALVRNLNASKLYVVGRSKYKFSPPLAELASLNPGASIEFVEAQLSLLKDVDSVCDVVKSREKKLDLLYMSPGYLAFGGPDYTSEGIDTCLSLSYYARMRMTSNLLPLLQNSQSPRVLSVLAGGQERRLITDDLGLKENYSILNVVDQTTTMHTLAFEHLAKYNPSISFLHAYPGWVKTDIVKNLFSLGQQHQGHLWWQLMDYLREWMVDWLLLPVFNLIATSVEECGERQLFHATNARYASRQEQEKHHGDKNDHAGSTTTHSVLKDPYALCSVPGNGVYRVAANGETISDDKVLGPYRADNMPEKIWEHTVVVFEEALSKGEK